MPYCPGNFGWELLPKPKDTKTVILECETVFALGGTGFTPFSRAIVSFRLDDLCSTSRLELAIATVALDERPPSGIAHQRRRIAAVRKEEIGKPEHQTETAHRLPIPSEMPPNGRPQRQA